MIKEVTKTTGTRNLQHNRTAPKHYIYKDKRFARNKKHIVMCNASYLYNYIEISHNSLISFFLPLNNCYYSKMNEKETAMLKSIRNSFKVQNLSLFFCLFCFEGTLQQTKCAATHQRGRKSLKKSIQKYNKIVLLYPIDSGSSDRVSGHVVHVTPDLQTSKVATVSLIKHARPS